MVHLDLLSRWVVYFLAWFEENTKSVRIQIPPGSNKIEASNPIFGIGM